MGIGRKKQAEYEEIERILLDSPGLSARELARRIGVEPSVNAFRQALPHIGDVAQCVAQIDVGGPIELLIRQVVDARRKGQAEQVEKREHDFGIAMRIGDRFQDGQFGCVRQRLISGFR